MCGIAGIVKQSAGIPLSAAEMERVCDVIRHRGPNDAGVHIGKGVALGALRLSILDLSPRGHMPMWSSCGRYCIAYNGEVYNYQELRSRLKSRGLQFRSNTDTEVVLELFAAEGPDCLQRLNGMFAVAIWDEHERSIFLARDRLGVKPLYYSVTDETLRFASEQKALFALGTRGEFDPSTWEELLCFRHVAGARTPYAGIQRLLPGHYFRWRDGRGDMHRWWKLADRAHEVREQFANADWREYSTTLAESIKTRLQSDVPVGVFLSGGLDSSAVAAEMVSLRSGGADSFTMRFEHSGYDEGPIAAEVIARYGLRSHDVYPRPTDLPDLLTHASWLLDEPLAHGNDLFLYAVAREAKPHVTVLLSGEGADETLGGYVRYQPLRFPHLLRAVTGMPRRVLRSFSPRVRKLARFGALGRLDRMVLFNSSNILPSDLVAFGLQPGSSFDYREQMLREAMEYSDEPVRQAMYLDQHTFLCSLLDRNDRMTMGASIECRVPFLDYRLVEMAAVISTKRHFELRRGKRLLRRAMRDRLPAAVLRHPKWGFGVPWSEFLRKSGPLREIVATLADREPVLTGPLDRHKVRSAVNAFLAGSDEHYHLVLELLMLVQWYATVPWGTSSSQTRPVVIA